MKFTDMLGDWWPKSFPSSFPVTFMWPMLLWLLLAVPLLVVIYVWLLRRKKKASVRFASLAIVRGPWMQALVFAATYHRSCFCWLSR